MADERIPKKDVADETEGKKNKRQVKNEMHG
jgi:hypothetical protein